MPRFVEFHYRHSERCLSVNTALLAAYGVDMSDRDHAWLQVGAANDDDSPLGVQESYEEVKAKLEKA